MIAFIRAKRIAFVAMLLLPALVFAQSTASGNMHLVSAADLATVLRGHGPKPLVLQVGPERLYRTAHIRGAEYAGMAAESAGMQKLRDRVQGLKRNAAIVIYCGCCPWEHCPNMRPAYEELRKMGFSNVKALYLPTNFKTDWDDRGYPTEKSN